VIDPVVRKRKEEKIEGKSKNGQNRRKGKTGNKRKKNEEKCR
jgi:hypothetical protein